MIPDTFYTRTFIYISAVAQTAVAPLSLIYYLYYFTTEKKLFTVHPSIDTLIHYWLGCELLFYIFFQITHNRMQRLLPTVAPSPKERMELYKLCVSTIDDPKVWTTGWFSLAGDPSKHPKFEEVYRENIAEWVSWAYFASSLEEVLDDESATEDLNTMLNDFEAKFDIQFKEGYNEDIVAFRTTLDPVHAYHRPLAFYTLVMFLTTLFGYYCQHSLRFKKYGHDSRSILWNLIEPQQVPAFNNLARLSCCSNNNDVKSKQHQDCHTEAADGYPNKVPYWFRDGDHTLKPIVFIHGIGAGLMCYFPFLKKLADTDAPIFLVELPYVSMQCTEDVPTMQETVRDFQNMLERHHFKDAVFISHSLGTAVTSWVLKSIPKSVAGVILIDPICFMLHYKDICANFIYRTPKTAAEGLVKYFASSELYISYFITRHFHWFQAVLFVKPQQKASLQQVHRSKSYDDIASSTTNILAAQLPGNTKVYLSEKDNIVNSIRVADYLNRCDVDNVVMKGLDHASFLLSSSWQQDMLATVQQFISVET